MRVTACCAAAGARRNLDVVEANVRRREINHAERGKVTHGPRLEVLRVENEAVRAAALRVAAVVEPDHESLPLFTLEPGTRGLIHSKQIFLNRKTRDVSNRIHSLNLAPTAVRITDKRMFEARIRNR